MVERNKMATSVRSTRLSTRLYGAAGLGLISRPRYGEPQDQGRNHWGGRGGPDPPNFAGTPPTFWTTFLLGGPILVGSAVRGKLRCVVLRRFAVRLRVTLR
jgi:hypothetical protein